MRSVLLALLLCLPTFVFAQSSGGAELRNSGTDFVKVCGASVQGQSSQYAAVCNIWLTGVVDGLQAYDANLKTLPLFDAPNITVGDVSKLLVNYVTKHPQQAQLPTAASSARRSGRNLPAQRRRRASDAPKEAVTRQGSHFSANCQPSTDNCSSSS